MKLRTLMSYLLIVILTTPFSSFSQEDSTDIRIETEVDIGERLDRQLNRLNSMNMVKTMFFVSMSSYLGYHAIEFLGQGIAKLWSWATDKEVKQQRWEDYQRAFSLLEKIEENAPLYARRMEVLVQNLDDLTSPTNISGSDLQSFLIEIDSQKILLEQEVEELKMEIRQVKDNSSQKLIAEEIAKKRIQLNDISYLYEISQKYGRDIPGFNHETNCSILSKAHDKLNNIELTLQKIRLSLLSGRIGWWRSYMNEIQKMYEQISYINYQQTHDLQNLVNEDYQNKLSYLEDRLDMEKELYVRTCIAQVIPSHLVRDYLTYGQLDFETHGYKVMPHLRINCENEFTNKSKAYQKYVKESKFLMESRENNRASTQQKSEERLGVNVEAIQNELQQNIYLMSKLREEQLCYQNLYQSEWHRQIYCYSLQKESPGRFMGFFPILNKIKIALNKHCGDERFRFTPNWEHLKLDYEFYIKKYGMPEDLSKSPYEELSWSVLPSFQLKNRVQSPSGELMTYDEIYKKRVSSQNVEK